MLYERPKIMNMKLMPATLILLFAAAFALNQTHAHHAATMFDREQTVELVGTVRDFQWTSPHIWIQMQIETDSGEVEEWSIEGGTPSRLYRSGWRPSTFKPGDSVTIRGYPMRDGGKAALFIGAKLEDGTTLGRY
jgi:hypothetical protein